jgi:hypothetical protein
LDKQAKKMAVQNLNSLEEKEKLRQKKKNVISNDSEKRKFSVAKSHHFNEPTIQQVQEYFA